MRNKHFNRVSGFAAFLAGAFLLVNGVARGAVEDPGLKDETELQTAEWNVMDILIQTYGDTDWSAVAALLDSNPDDARNPKIMLIPLSLGNGYLNRFEKSKDVSDFELALVHFEWVAEKYPLWKSRWMTPAVVQYLVVSVDRLRKFCPIYFPLPQPGSAKRTERLWKRAMVILEREATDRRTVTVEFRDPPSDSGSEHDSSSRDKTFEAVVLATAANFLPDASVSRGWDRRARQLVYDSVRCLSEQEVPTKTCPISTDASAELVLLSQAALTYRLTNRPIPEQFVDGIRVLYEKYDSDFGKGRSWRIGDEEEDDRLPFVFEPDLERKAVARKASGSLWKRVPKISVVDTEVELRDAVQNSKVVFYYLMSSYLWHFSTPDECFEVRFKEPMEGVAE